MSLLYMCIRIEHERVEDWLSVYAILAIKRHKMSCILKKHFNILFSDKHFDILYNQNTNRNNALNYNCLYTCQNNNFVLTLHQLATIVLWSLNSSGRNPHSEKSLDRSMLFYSRNWWQQNWAQLVLYINSDCVYIGDIWLQL